MEKVFKDACTAPLRHMAESKFQMDGVENNRIKVYDKVQDYIANGSYP